MNKPFTWSTHYQPTGWATKPSSGTLWADFNGRNHNELAIKYRLSVQQVYNIIRDHRRQLEQDRRQADLYRAATSLLANPHTDQFVQAYLHGLLVREAHSLAATDVLLILAPPCAAHRPNPASTAPAVQTPKTLGSPAGFPSLSAALLGLAAAWGSVWRKCHSLVNSH